LHQMIMAVINNAIKFSLNDQPVEIELSKNDIHAVLSITNYGKPIPPNLLPYIFERYYKTNEEGGGTGLGLSIAKKIAERHGIEIIVSSKEEFTRFSFIIPLATAHMNINIDEKVNLSTNNQEK